MSYIIIALCIYSFFNTNRSMGGAVSDTSDVMVSMKVCVKLVPCQLHDVQNLDVNENVRFFIIILTSFSSLQI